MKKTFFLFMIFLSCIAGARSRKHKHKYYLDYNGAEDVLAGIKLSTPFYDDEWLKVLKQSKRVSRGVASDQDLRTQTYTVNGGEDMWDVSNKLFADPWLWRKIWQANPNITNPHELEIGQILHLYRESASENVIRIPLVKLRHFGATDLDSDTFVNVNIRNRFMPRVLVAGSEELLGEITGAYTEKEGLDYHNSPYLVLYAPGDVKPGMKFDVVHVERDVEEETPDGKTFLGKIVRVMGEIRLTGKGERLYQAEIINMSGPIRRGDKLYPYQDPVNLKAVLSPPGNFETKIVTGEMAEKSSFGQGDYVLLNKGYLDGMKLGFKFRAVMDTDYLTKKKEDVEPYFKGEVQVIHVGQLAAVGFIVRNTDPLAPGDLLVPLQRFPNRPPPPTRPIQSLELD